MVGAGGFAGLAVGLVAVYGIGTFLGNPAADGGCAPAVKTAERVAPFARGEVAPAGYRQAEAEQLVKRLARYP